MTDAVSEHTWVTNRLSEMLHSTIVAQSSLVVPMTDTANSGIQRQVTHLSGLGEYIEYIYFHGIYANILL